jgi:hypothetical protein
MLPVLTEVAAGYFGADLLGCRPVTAPRSRPRELRWAPVELRPFVVVQTPPVPCCLSRLRGDVRSVRCLRRLPDLEPSTDFAPHREPIAGVTKASAVVAVAGNLLPFC